MSDGTDVEQAPTKTQGQNLLEDMTAFHKRLDAAAARLAGVVAAVRGPLKSNPPQAAESVSPATSFFPAAARLLVLLNATAGALEATADTLEKTF